MAVPPDGLRELADVVGVDEMTSAEAAAFLAAGTAVRAAMLGLYAAPDVAMARRLELWRRLLAMLVTLEKQGDEHEARAWQSGPTN